jgi:hypothetical protein
MDRRIAYPLFGKSVGIAPTAIHPALADKPAKADKR